MPVRFCGLTAMGSAIAERLLAQGHRLTVWNRIADRAAVLVTRGATQATTPPIMFTFAHPVAGGRKKLARCMSPLMARRVGVPNSSGERQVPGNERGVWPVDRSDGYRANLPTRSHCLTVTRRGALIPRLLA